MERYANYENAVYFAHYGSQCFVWPFLPLFLSRFMADPALGLLMGLGRVASVLAAPGWAWLADAKVGRGRVFGGAWAAWQVLTVVLVLVARRGHYASTLAAHVARALAEAPLTPFIDAGVLARLAGGDRGFGSARLFGSLAWGGLAPVAGALYGRFGFAPNVLASAVLSIAMARCAARVVPSVLEKRRPEGYAAVGPPVLNPFAIVDDEDDEEEETSVAVEEAKEAAADDINPFALRDDRASEPPRATDRATARDARVIFFACVVVVGSGFGFVMNFLFVYVTRQLGGSSLLCGVALFVECAVEIPCLHASDGLLAKYGSRLLLATVLALYAVRCAGYALLSSFPGRPWLVLAVEPLHGVTFALFYTAGVTGAKAMFPADRETVAQGLFSAAFTGGTGAGAALGGLAVPRVGFEATFLGFAVLFAAAAAAALHLLEDDAPPPGGGAEEEEEEDDDDDGFALENGVALTTFREYRADENAFDDAPATFREYRSDDDAFDGAPASAYRGADDDAFDDGGYY